MRHWVRQLSSSDIHLSLHLSVHPSEKWVKTIILTEIGFVISSSCFSKRSKISLGSKALSHDSVFVSDSSEANEALGASQDSIHGKVKSLQVQSHKHSVGAWCTNKRRHNNDDNDDNFRYLHTHIHTLYLWNFLFFFVLFFSTTQDSACVIFWIRTEIKTALKKKKKSRG